MTRARHTTADTDSLPALTIGIEEAAAVEYAAVPTLRFAARIDSAGAGEIRSIALTTQIRIAVDRRTYDGWDQERLVELFGAPGEWGQTLRSLLWTHVTTHVPAFTGTTIAQIPVTCTYDFEVATAKYFHALTDGEVPLEFLFSGTAFYSVDGRLRAAQLPWDTEARFRMPVRVWQDLMQHYFPHSAWLRLDRDVFDQLYAYKAGNTLATWEDAVAALLRAAERGTGGE